VPIVGRNGEFALLHGPGCYDGYMHLVPPGVQWENRCPARILLRIPFYRPGNYAERVKCPAMLVLAREDQILPLAAAERVATRMPRAEVVRYDGDHFACYEGELFERLVEQQATFLARCLQPSSKAVRT
jgi:pimeloyl-ACP methyl ester carboxylesterase